MPTIPNWSQPEISRNIPHEITAAIDIGIRFMTRRRQAREAALQVLYQQDLNPDMDMHTVRTQIGERVPDQDLNEFAWHLFIGVMERRLELDSRIEAIAQNWSLKRMAPTDRNALRMGAYELIFTSTPPRVVIDEALELAKLFGSAQSAQFVNGILDRLIPPERREEMNATETPPSDLLASPPAETQQ